jgi:DNA-binding GntR family transcriptional regulator
MSRTSSGPNNLEQGETFVKTATVRAARRTTSTRAAVAPPVPRMTPVQPRTMVEQAAEAIVGAAARGVFLPGDRLVEAEIARDLNISRVPVREALRLLESQGIVTNTPYKGMRLMTLDNARMREIVGVRTVLERLAAEELFARKDPDALDGVRNAFARLRDSLKRSDRAEIAAADIEFHTELVRATGNQTLLGLWQSLARQLNVVFGLTIAEKSAAHMIETHTALLEALEKADLKAFDKAFTSHIGWHVSDFDVEAAIQRRRAKPTRR